MEVIIIVLEINKIGVISDTHGLIRDEINLFLKGCDLIIHAGDMVNEDIILHLRSMSKVIAVRGNNDYSDKFSNYADFEEVIVNGHIKICVVHDINDIEDKITNYDIVIHGHTHKPMRRYVSNTLVLNPGSFGPKRFSLPISLATIDLKKNISVKFYEI